MPPLGNTPQTRERHYRAAALWADDTAQRWQNYATDLREERVFCAEDSRKIAADSEAWARRTAEAQGE